ncbi:hypothetical protein LOD99_13524 [Oopsacas minuta]|uniref:C2H2-type domain-containing protein n=1 Tax=Oopsacas minuta TaxID=111878 RepID=A0AAV7KL45_9METZ|nr:hypothetical protein LOD99_13524 [Oopsacas minuta]
MSIDILSQERFVLREKQSRSTLQNVKIETIAEDCSLVNMVNNFPMENGYSTIKIENEDSAFSNLAGKCSSFNDSFSLKIDSFSSHFMDDSRPENSTFKSESSQIVCENPIRHLPYSQYLNNFTQVINIKHLDHFDICLKGIHSTEFELNSNLSKYNDISNANTSRIVPTFQRFKDLEISQLKVDKFAAQVTDTTTKVAKKDKLLVKKSKIIQQKIKLQKKQKRQFICETCSAKYFYELPFINHISKHIPTYECKHCKHSYPTQRSLSSHMRVHNTTHYSKRPTLKRMK